MSYDITEQQTVSFNKVRCCVCSVQFMMEEHYWDARGVKHGMSVLTPELVRAIRKIYRPKTFGVRKTGKMLGLNHTTVLNVVKGNTWKWLIE